MENELTDIDIIKLKRTVDAIFDHILNDVGITKVKLIKEADFYWEVPSDRLYAVQQDQPQLDIGRLSDDWEFLTAILEDRQQAVGLMFTHLAPILRYVGEKIGR